MLKRKFDDVIDIRGVDKLALLKRLWLQQPPALFFAVNPTAKIPKWNDDEAKKALKRGYIDHFQGRCIKTNLSGDFAKPYEYDKSGHETFEDALRYVKQSSITSRKD